ncbi:hypothetical protein SDC9_167812 [bioreactor metagenome]|uniref:Uncharacterized protein n=1 Tax=bioreactor metagenome TaxID=1076179 RepID=A0A645G940_9ZZZZ
MHIRYEYTNNKEGIYYDYEFFEKGSSGNDDCAIASWLIYEYLFPRFITNWFFYNSRIFKCWSCHSNGNSIILSWNHVTGKRYASSAKARWDFVGF